MRVRKREGYGQYSVSYTSDMNEAGFGVGNATAEVVVIRPETVSKSPVQKKEIFLQTQLKRRDFATVSFPPSELPPRMQKIFRTNYAIKKSTMSPPPDKTPSVIRKIRLLHKEIYIVGQKLPKREKLGIHSAIETRIVELLVLAVTAAFQSPQTKRPTLELLRVRTEVLKHLVRTEHELSILDDKTYLRIAERLIEISKMTTGWITYTQKGA